MNQPDIVHREGFLVLGTVSPRKPGVEHPETLAAIWRGFESHHEIIRRHSVDSKYYGISFAKRPDGSFDYMAGMAVGPVDDVDIPEGLAIREIPAATYAVFACPVQEIGRTYQHIVGEWRAGTRCEIDEARAAFEVYPPATDTNAPVLIHIPLRAARAT